MRIAVFSNIQCQQQSLADRRPHARKTKYKLALPGSSYFRTITHEYQYEELTGQTNCANGYCKHNSISYNNRPSMILNKEPSFIYSTHIIACFFYSHKKHGIQIFLMISILSSPKFWAVLVKI